MQIENCKLKIGREKAAPLSCGAMAESMRHGKFGVSPNLQFSICNFQFAMILLPFSGSAS
jgi:hypothetical protein